MSEYKLTIGLEIHAELKTKTKMFCDSLNDPNEHHPNINICPVCMGHPGTLPVINKQAVECVVRVGMALGGKIPEYSQFDRKNYFYPDLPKGYQISQYKHPLVDGGELLLPGSGKKIRVTRVHLEEDTGRLVHEGNDSLVDFNRAGVPLMELVTEPDISSAAEARAFAEELQLLLRYLDVSEADMEKGEMRVEANISIAKLDEERGIKVEIKNLNSFRAVERAIAYEHERQAKVLDDGKKVIQETRGWDEEKQHTFSQRKKESAHDYRYFPEPDLPPLDLADKKYFDLEMLRASLPELPWQKRDRFAREYGVLGDASQMMVADKAMADFFESAISEIMEWVDGDNGQARRENLIKLAINYTTSDLRALMKNAEGSFGDLRITPENFAELIKMAALGEVSSRGAKEILAEMFSGGGDPSDILESKGLKQVSNESELVNVVQKIIQANPETVVDYKAGKAAALQFLVGQMMKETKGAANPQMAAQALKDTIDKI
ncbi:MAG: Asp-tRNA(Asn)/Glu-tRNA(Gln) amidotransferase subunit GatB [Candidatus Niyogibacteria bacterium]|nr:Asp-tRNA(Asn)/Glu-tRNA(Gln) amidotransferase subunit GatB [Candidatus Niyogibacteria bacterium]